MRKLAFFSIILSFACFAFNIVSSPETAVMRAAEKDMPAFLERIPAGQELNFGFTSRSEFKTCAVSKPYHTITLSAEFFSDEKLDPAHNYIAVLNEWRVPVTVSGENRVLLTVNEKDSVYAVNDIGGSALAKELQSKTPADSAGNNYLLRIYPMTMDFIVHTQPGQSIAEGSYIPMNSALMSIKQLNSKSVFTQWEVLQLVKAKSREQGQH